jgi:hypothetical protein
VPTSCSRSNGNRTRAQGKSGLTTLGCHRPVSTVVLASVGAHLFSRLVSAFRASDCGDFGHDARR